MMQVHWCSKVSLSCVVESEVHSVFYLFNHHDLYFVSATWKKIDRDVRCSRSPQHTRALYRAVGHYLHTYFKAKYLAFCPLTELTMGGRRKCTFSTLYTDLLEETRHRLSLLRVVRQQIRNGWVRKNNYGHENNRTIDTDWEDFLLTFCPTEVAPHFTQHILIHHEVVWELWTIHCCHHKRETCCCWTRWFTRWNVLIQCCKKSS